MKLKNSMMLGITALTLGTGVALLQGSTTASAHIWNDGTPSAVHGTWRTHSIYVKAIEMRNHATFKATAHTVSFSYNASSRVKLRDTYWRKTGAHSYTIHGAWSRDDGCDHRITAKKISKNHIRLYFDGRTITKSSGLPNSFYR
ncbi:hypothetical protein IWT140_00152 [Secundilactobacillus pentosiphilus]|uniref:Uncharacterized protein n=1 Tax=Secundilactobacillus pentosiphilus TaxID=1714682 RepID=A0A1Z5ILC6_9LACO|nr:hypothetical protein [Secundilactobacillus pentosiphilus]GAX02555.1 hypothetical protein IWT140_00152 [Secundilactobacillus pentosiphilus]